MKLLLAWFFCVGKVAAAGLSLQAFALIRSDRSGAAVAAGTPAQLTWIGLHKAWLGAGQRRASVRHLVGASHEAVEQRHWHVCEKLKATPHCATTTY